METAVSGLIPAAMDRLLGGQTPEAVPAQAPADWRDGWFIYQCADVSDETAAQITKAGAWPAFNAFFRLLWKRQREAHKAGRLDAESACRAGVLLGEGIRGLARSIGLTPKAMDRQVRELHRLGILAVAKPPAAIVRDDKGRIVRRPAHKGTVPASKIRFNAGEEHKRPKNRQGSNRPLRVVGTEAGQGSDRPLAGRRPKGANRTTPISPRHISPSAGGQAVGDGRPAEAPGTRPTAGEAPVVRPWTGPDEAARLAMLRRIEAQKAAWDAKDAEAREAQRPAPTATEAAGRLAAAVADLPAASRQKAKRVARRMTKAERQAEADAKALADLIERKRTQEAEAEKAQAKAYRAAVQKACRESKKAKREPVAAGTQAGGP